MLVAGMIGVLVFLGVCGTVLRGVRADRTALEARVCWLMGLQALESPPRGRPGRRHRAGRGGVRGPPAVHA
jgi:hypothetical protein